jgi:PTH1 family peptidyl-tRNA hydrolase
MEDNIAFQYIELRICTQLLRLFYLARAKAILMPMIYTLVPLGNPGEKYAHTRHNAARIVVDLMRDALEKLETVEVFMPDTFMNESGRAISEYLRYHEGRELVVMYDDKDLPLGSIRISHDRGDGGHNGVKSVIESLGTREFTRIRIGIAPENVDGTNVKAPHGEVVQDYVLGKFRDVEEEKLREVIPQVVGALQAIAEAGYQKAMERFN